MCRVSSKIYDIMWHVKLNWRSENEKYVSPQFVPLSYTGDQTPFVTTMGIWLAGLAAGVAVLVGAVAALVEAVWAAANISTWFWNSPGSHGE